VTCILTHPFASLAWLFAAVVVVLVAAWVGERINGLLQHGWRRLRGLPPQ